jgi:lipopolysaccharide heptosyltransferase II
LTAHRAARRILLVRLRQIGDVVFTTPAVRALRCRFPDAHISYLVEPTSAPVVQGNPHIDDVIIAPPSRGGSGLVGEIALIRRLRRERFDLAIDFHGGPRASLLTWLSGAPERIGYRVVGRSWMYTTRVDRARTLRPRHSVENQWDLLSPLDIALPPRRDSPVEMPEDAAAAAAVAGRLSEADIASGARLVVMHVSAGNPFRRWPEPSFAAVAAALAAAADVAVAVTAGPSDLEAARRVIADARRRAAAAGPRILDCGEFSLLELKALVERAALYIGGDSGPLHVAATSRVPIVALYGPTLPARSAPWRDPSIPSEAIEVTELACRPCDQRRCEPGDFRCLTRLDPDRVLSAACRLLGVRTSRRAG